MSDSTNLRRAKPRILVVGHPRSGYEAVEAALRQMGMAEARASRVQRLSPVEVSGKLLESAGVSGDFNPGIQQIHPGPLWNELALDLFVNNTEAELWGWSDPQAIYLLDYWRDLDPDTRIVCVYGSPAQALASAFAENPPDEQSALAFLNGCIAYNDALMHFFNRNRDRCLLVHSAQAIVNPGALKEELARLLGRELDQHEPASPPTTTGKAVLQVLAASALQEYPQALASFEELQSVADLPLSSETEISSLVAWREWTDLATQTKAAIEAAKQDTSLQEENELLLLQLHQVQEELERYYLENQQLKGGAKRQVAAPSRPAALYGAADRVKRQLSYRLGATMLSHTKSVGGWLGMPAALLREARAFEQEQKARGDKKLPPISRYADAHEAEKVRKHLSYRLGSALLANYRSPVGWLKLPGEISRQVREFERDRAGRK